MSSSALRSLKSAHPSESQILKGIAEIITRITGVQLGEKQRHMVESRLKKRVLEIGLSNLVEYAQYFNENEQIETQALISLLTTHHTYFFREFSHFEFLAQVGLARLLPAVQARPDKTVRVWSAACSRGQEAYSLAMFLENSLNKIAPGIKFEIFATDIDAESITIAQNGVYHRKDIKEVPASYLEDHWVRGTGAISDFVKAKTSLKKNIKFETLNLIDLGQLDRAPIFDVIFCRNVFIYFSAEQITKISASLLKRLSPTGYLFIGISESLHGLDLSAQSAGPSIYTHPTPKESPPLLRPAPAPASRIRVLCVDDSPSILALLKMIFTKTNGFDLVGTAVNGIDAAEKVKALTPDIITLDIHMPEMDGIAYLKKNFDSYHPAVVMVSSVNRDNADLALQALEIGASDYVEKPALNQLKDRAEEIRMKVRCALRNRTRSRTPVKGAPLIDHEFKLKMKILNPEEKLRVFFGQLSDRKQIGLALRELKAEDPPTLILFEQSLHTLAQFAEILGKEARTQIEVMKDGETKLIPGRIYVGDFNSFSGLKDRYSGKAVSALVVGDPTPAVCRGLEGWKGIQILIEELSPGREHPLLKVATDQFPVTSFIALSQEYLSR